MGAGVTRRGAEDTAIGRLRSAGPLVAVGLIVLAFVLAIVGGSGDTGAPVEATGPTIASAATLAGAPEEVGHPVYWVGSRPSSQLELQEERDGSVFLRYLPPGAEAGDPNNDLLTVGSYPMADALAATRRAAEAAGAEIRTVRDGGIAFDNPQSRGSVYLAFPGSDVQVEVYDPQPGRAMELIESGAVRPVGE
jgi:hypothetical protein